MTLPRPAAFALVFFVLVCLSTTGCSAFRGASANANEITRRAAMDYPRDAPYGPDLDILVVRSNAEIRLVNRTAHNYSAMQLWLNQQYTAPGGRIIVGTDNERLLTDFINRHREPYPVGTFLNPDKTAVLVLAELYNPSEGVRHRLIVRPGNEASIVPFETLDN